MYLDRREITAHWMCDGAQGQHACAPSHGERVAVDRVQCDSLEGSSGGMAGEGDGGTAGPVRGGAAICVLGSASATGASQYRDRTPLLKRCADAELTLLVIATS
jgi:hypothetical protein